MRVFLQLLGFFGFLATASCSSASSEREETTPEVEVRATELEPEVAEVEPEEPEQPVEPDLPRIEPFEVVDEGVPGLRIPIHDPSGRAMHGLHRALRRAEAGEGRARLVFYGASHVASDWITNPIRHRLQERFGDAGHGFILPAQPWRSYRHLDITIRGDRDLWSPSRIRTNHIVEEPYGLAGVYVQSEERGALGSVTTPTRGLGSLVTSFSLFYWKMPGGGHFNAQIDGRQLERVSTHSETPGPEYSTFRVPEGPHRFDVQVVGDGPVRLFGVSMERDEPGVIVDTLGINGARIRYHLLWEDQLYREHLARIAPDFVALAYGTNEAGDTDVPIADYEQRVRQVVSRVRQIAPEASCLLIGPSDRPIRDGDRVRDRPRTAQLVEVQRRVSEELGCGFFDLVAFMGGTMSMVDWVEHSPAYGARDHVHYTRRGYERLADVLHGALMHGYDQ